MEGSPKETVCFLGPTLPEQTSGSNLWLLAGSLSRERDEINHVNVKTTRPLISPLAAFANTTTCLYQADKHFSALIIKAVTHTSPLNLSSF